MENKALYDSIKAVSNSTIANLNKHVRLVDPKIPFREILNKAFI